MAFGKIKSFSVPGLRTYSKEEWEEELKKSLCHLPNLKFIKEIKVDGECIGDLFVCWSSNISNSFVVAKTLNKQTIERTVLYHHLVVFAYLDKPEKQLEVKKDWYWLYKCNSPFTIFYTLRDDLKERGLMV